jgi:hypothetical protein
MITPVESCVRAVKCPVCGAQVQATVRLDMSLDENGNWYLERPPDVSSVTLYCANDCALGGDDAKFLVDAQFASDVATHVVRKYMSA